MTERFDIEPQFLQGSRGRLLAVLYSPSDSPQGAVLHLPAWGEEMNKSRAMVAEQCRAWARQGWTALTVDLYGCGDSEGDFGDARWDIWIEDLERCAQWLRELLPEGSPLWLWAHRAGALLLPELAPRAQPVGLVLWQPVLDGAVALQQFLRLRLAAGFGGSARESMAELKAALAAGEPLEVAGYELHPALAAALQAAKLTPFEGPERVAWLEVSPAGETCLPAGDRLAEAWAGLEVGVERIPVAGEPFWMTQELSRAPGLIDASRRVFGQ